MVNLIKRRRRLKAGCLLAKLAIEEGHASGVEVSVRECKEQFHREQQADDELSASITLIDVLLAQGKQGEAQEEMGADQQLGKATQNRLLRLQFELASGRVLLTSEHPDASRPPV
jgi:ATP/maltotriose-dependent transcriptional regulator MalT